MEADGIFEKLPKKEVASLKKEYEKLNKNLCGIRNMEKLPQAVVIVDSTKEYNAIREANILGIPVFGLIDTNCDPDDVDVCIPANDDAIRSVKLILTALADAIIEGRDGVVLRDMNASDDDVSMDAVVKSTVTNKVADEKETVQETEENK